MSITKDGLFKYQALNERQRKNLIILDTIRKSGPVAKATLSRKLDYNIVTLTHHIEDYIKKGLVRESGFDGSSGGRKPVLMELNNDGAYIIGIDFNRGSLSGVVTDLMLKVIAEAKMSRPVIEQGVVQKSLADLIRELIKKAGVDASNIRFVGIGVYGAIGEKNGALKGLDEEKGKSRATLYFMELKQDIEKEFNIPTFFGQDASFAALGEKARNPSADVDSMLYMFQDIGKGVIVKGEIYCSTDAGGVDLEGITGNLDDAEKAKLREESSYLRPWDPQMSLKGEALKIIETGVGTKIVELLDGKMETLGDDVIIRAANGKDEIAIELIEGIGINLGIRIAYLINLFSPRIVIIGGGIEKSGGLLFKQIEKTIEKLALEKSRQSVKIAPSLLGEQGVTLGAAAAALRELFLEA